MSRLRIVWSSRFGFYLAAVGAAAGLGNFWRFPYVVAENGGGAFVLLYVLLAFTVGLSLLIGELILGRVTGQPLLPSMKRISARAPIAERAWYVRSGWFSLVASFVVLAYYSVISGWALYLSFRFIAHFFGFSVVDAMTTLTNNPALQVALVGVHLFLAGGIVAKGAKDGLEKWTGWLMPVFLLLVGLLMIQALSLSSTSAAARFLFYPDFSKLTWASFAHALGHVAFTLSVGFGTMVTFGSYLRDREHIPTAGFRLTLIDTTLSVVVALCIFSVALGAGDVSLRDPRLLFDALPGFLLSTQGGAWFGFAFFLGLYLAALNASIGLVENIVSNAEATLKISRRRISFGLTFAALALAAVPALSHADWQPGFLGGKSLLEWMDALVVNWLLPLVMMSMSYALARGLQANELEENFVDPNRIETAALFSHWKWILRRLVPAVVVVALALQFVEILKS